MLCYFWQTIYLHCICLHFLLIAEAPMCWAYDRLTAAQHDRITIVKRQTCWVRQNQNMPRKVATSRRTSLDRRRTLWPHYATWVSMPPDDCMASQQWPEAMAGRSWFPIMLQSKLVNYFVLWFRFNERRESCCLTRIEAIRAKLR